MLFISVLIKHSLLRWHNTAAQTGGNMSSSTTQHLSGLSLREHESSGHGHHLVPAQTHYRARSPSPLDGPNHHHLVMETRKMSHNNNVTSSDNIGDMRQPAAVSILVTAHTMLGHQAQLSQQLSALLIVTTTSKNSSIIQSCSLN